MRFLTEAGDDGDNFGVHVTYEDLYASIVFLAAIYIAGVFVARFLAMPALVGEIFMGIILGPNLLDIVPNEEAFVMLGEVGLFLLVLEAGIDIDLTTLKLVGTRGVTVAVVGAFLPVAIASMIALILGYKTMTAVAAGCVFASTSLGIVMNIMRQSHILNTPVGQLIVAAAIIDDLIALVILSQLRAFASDGAVSVADALIPAASTVGFILIGGGLGVFVLPKALDRFIFDPLEMAGKCNRGWISLAIMFILLLALMPATYYAKASPLMGAFLAGLVFCSNAPAHHMFVSQFKRVMQWLLRIFFAASIGFQVPIQMFANGQVLLQGLAFTCALSGKVVVGFMVPNFSSSKNFRGLHLRDCLVVGLSMMAEGEFAFVIAVFAVANDMISQELYASVVLAVLVSTVIGPFFLRYTISYFNKQIESAVYGESADALLEKELRENTAIFYCIQIKSAPAWGIQTIIMRKLNELSLDIIDHRSWHPRPPSSILINEVYVKDTKESAADGFDVEKYIVERTDGIRKALVAAIQQEDSIIRVQRWYPDVFHGSFDTSVHSISERIVHATGVALEISRENSMKEESSQEENLSQEQDYVVLKGEGLLKGSLPSSAPSLSQKRQISHLDTISNGRLEGLFRRDRHHGQTIGDTNNINRVEQVEMLDVHGIGTGYNEMGEEYDVHGHSLT